MAAERVALLYMAIDDDDDLRRRVHAGEFTAEEVAELTDYERRLLTDAAGEELPDVTGYALDGPKIGFWAPYRHITINYVSLNVTDPSVQASFIDHQNAAIVDTMG